MVLPRYRYANRTLELWYLRLAILLLGLLDAALDFAKRIKIFANFPPVRRTELLLKIHEIFFRPIENATIRLQFSPPLRDRAPIAKQSLKDHTRVRFRGKRGRR